jgi:hypothetical protein
MMARRKNQQSEGTSFMNKSVGFSENHSQYARSAERLIDPSKSVKSEIMQLASLGKQMANEIRLKRLPSASTGRNSKGRNTSSLTCNMVSYNVRQSYCENSS